MNTNCERCDGAGEIQTTVRQRLGEWSFMEDVEYDCPDCEGTGLAPEFKARVLAAEWAWAIYCQIAGRNTDWDCVPALVRG